MDLQISSTDVSILYDFGTVDGAPYTRNPSQCLPDPKHTPLHKQESIHHRNYSKQWFLESKSSIYITTHIDSHDFSKSWTRLRLTQSQRMSAPFPAHVKMYSDGLWKQILQWIPLCTATLSLCAGCCSCSSRHENEGLCRSSFRRRELFYKSIHSRKSTKIPPPQVHSAIRERSTFEERRRETWWNRPIRCSRLSSEKGRENMPWRDLRGLWGHRWRCRFRL